MFSDQLAALLVVVGGWEGRLAGWLCKAYVSSHLWVKIALSQSSLSFPPPQVASPRREFNFLARNLRRLEQAEEEEEGDHQPVIYLKGEILRLCCGGSVCSSLCFCSGTSYAGCCPGNRHLHCDASAVFDALAPFLHCTLQMNEYSPPYPTLFDACDSKQKTMPAEGPSGR